MKYLIMRSNTKIKEGAFIKHSANVYLLFFLTFVLSLFSLNNVTAKEADRQTKLVALLNKKVDWLLINGKNFSIKIRSTDKFSRVFEMNDLKKMMVLRKTFIEGIEEFEDDFISYASDTLKIYKDFIESLPKDKKLQLVKFLIDQGRMPGEYVNLGWFVLPRPYSFPYFTEDEVRNAFEVFPEYPKKVHYDGIKEITTYNDPILERMAIIIATSISALPSRLKDDFDSLNMNIKEKFQLNTNSESMLSRVEPFDLIQSKISDEWMRVLNLNKEIVVSKRDANGIVGSFLLTTFGMDRSVQRIGADLKTPIFLGRKKESAEYLLLCSYDLDERLLLYNVFRDFQVEQESGSGIERVVPVSNSIEIDAFKFMRAKSKISINCQNEKFSLIGKAIQEKPIEPTRLTIAKDSGDPQSTISVVMTFGIADSINEKSIINLENILTKVWGYSKVHGFTIEDTIGKSKEILKNADMYLPVSHSNGLGRVLLGTNNSLYAEFEKNAQGRKIVLKILLPATQESSGSVFMSSDEIEDLLFERASIKNRGLFVLNTSCIAATH